MLLVKKSSLLDDVAKEMHGHPTTNNDGTLHRFSISLSEQLTHKQSHHRHDYGLRSTGSFPRL